MESILALPFDILKTNILPDVFHGCFVVTCTLFAFLGMVWLREQIVHGGGPDWLEAEQDVQGGQHQQQAPPPRQQQQQQQQPQPQQQQEQQADQHPENDNPPMQENESQRPVEVNSNNVENNIEAHDSGDANARNIKLNNDVAENGGIGFVDTGSSSSNTASGSENLYFERTFSNYNGTGDSDVRKQGSHAGGFGESSSLPEENDFNSDEVDDADFGSLSEHFGEHENLNEIEDENPEVEADNEAPAEENQMDGVEAGVEVPEGGENAQDDGNWNPIEWDRAVDELTWERLLGLDGSLVFLEHVFWVMSLNALFIFFFAFLPYHSGNMAINGLGLREKTAGAHFEGLITTLFGYCILGLVLVILHALASLLGLQRSKRILGLCYVIVKEMIHKPIIYYIRRLLVSSIIFGTAVVLMVWFPILIIRYLWPSFLPYAVALHFETQMNELSLELLLFQIIIPALLERSNPRIWMKSLIRLWCRCAAWLFGIHSYLLGDETDQNGNTENAENNDNNNQGVFNGLGAVHHQALLPREGPIGVQPYARPSWFYARIIGLLLAVCVSLVFASVGALTLPVWIGRQIMPLWLCDSPDATTSPISNVGDESSTRVHELYTVGCGIYICWLTGQAISLLRSWLPQGRAAIQDTEKLKQWCLWGTKSLIAFTFLLGIIPLLFGLFLELVVIVPLRVPVDQTPILFVWQDWALGVLYTKIACAMILMGPDWKMRRAIERVYRDGIRNMDLSFILCDLAIPVTAGFSLALAVPYATIHSIVPLITSDAELKNGIARILYPCLLLAFILSCLIAFQIRQFKKLYEHIKNDKYLVGKRLVNYDHTRSKGSNGA
ncbi:UNVERIFIED_CONTAM: hypothetical protein PYX00_007956 [Menopon gallinae]|uniref:RING-type E3 ubiquitin transferase n=1 Tax=Menopon gallinae TaxID=328185 RepID=A0AAW2HLC6_9NEOP